MGTSKLCSRITIDMILMVFSMKWLKLEEEIHLFKKEIIFIE